MSHASSFFSLFTSSIYWMSISFKAPIINIYQLLDMLRTHCNHLHRFDLVMITATNRDNPTKAPSSPNQAIAQSHTGTFLWPFSEASDAPMALCRAPLSEMYVSTLARVSSDHQFSQHLSNSIAPTEEPSPAESVIKHSPSVLHNADLILALQWPPAYHWIESSMPVSLCHN